MTSWQPIVPSDSALGRKAWSAASDIVESVFEKNYPPLEHKFRHCPEDEALLFAYWSLAQNDSAWVDHAIASLNTAIDSAAARTKYLGLYGGLCGIGWNVQHILQLIEKWMCASDRLKTESPTCGDEDSLVEVDMFVLRALRQSPFQDHYDLISGLVGYGVYFLERLPSDAAVKGLKLIIRHLASSAERSSEGVTWFTPKQFVPLWQRKTFPEGYYNLGVAHGIPGILHLLAELLGTGIEEATCGELLDGAMRWLLAHQTPPENLFRFCSWMTPSSGTDSRLAWCYGDPGVLAVLLQVARQTGRRDWGEFAHYLLDRCLAWPVDKSGLGDAPLCHGTAGIAHLFNRIYQSEGDPRCREASVSWFERALAMRQQGLGVAGFLQLTRPDPDGPVVWEPSPAFLDGAIGIALALLGALTPIEPQWDRLLLLSGHPVRAHRLCPERV